MGKRYKGQALAIVMIVLVIALVLGMAMLSRVMRDSVQTVNEKSSAEALSATDSIFDAVKGTSTETIKEVCNRSEYSSDIDGGAVCKITGSQNVSTFLTQLGVASDTSSIVQNCQSDTSTLEISTGLATSEDDYELRPDSVRSFVLRGQLPNPPSCSLNIEVEPRGNSVGGIIVSKIYGRNYVNGLATEFKPYAYSDILPYCVFSVGGDCSSNTNLTDTWTPVASGSTISIPLSASGGYNLDEVRLRGVNTAISIKASLSDPNCIEGWEMVKMVAGANCTGSYRAKEIQIPQQEWALPIFDYVLYNGNDILRAE